MRGLPFIGLIKTGGVRAWLDPVSSPSWVEGEDWQSLSFSGGVVFIERKASPKEWQIWMAWKHGRSG
ncbi:hypothetical protein ACOSP7_003194 [Xanthoceras sorbifolium]